MSFSELQAVVHTSPPEQIAESRCRVSCRHERLLAKKLGVSTIQVLNLEQTSDRGCRLVRVASAHELQAGRRHESAFDESGRLVRAAATILLVDQPALLLQERVQLPTGSGKDLPEILG
jgi:hypothetical protein